mmetsp:Transcript_52644/g.132409  ORF Transcript_52644/g.132409 Transcript_52644/m.132409 type:complete len:928 (+) Transcript_52644:80-2863(+)
MAEARVLITGHSNPDFDALASMVAAAKLHAPAGTPAVLLLPPGDVSQSMAEAMDYFPTLSQIVKRLPEGEAFTDVVIVDTNVRSRVGHVEQFLRGSSPGDAAAAPRPRVHVYDHHAQSARVEVPAHICVVRESGACTTLLCGLLRERGIAVSPEEATIFGLGLYEDTGFFTHKTTTPEDLHIAGWLRECGMDVDTIGNFCTPYSKGDIPLIDAMVRGMTHHTIAGVRVTFSEFQSDQNVKGLSRVVDRIVKTHRPVVFFLVAMLADHVSIVARSRTPRVDVARVCEHFGGGGHSEAAAATVRLAGMEEAKEVIVAMLITQLGEPLRVKDHMTQPAIAADVRDTLVTWHQKMMELHLKAVPIVDGEEVVGVVDRRTLDRALRHGMGAHTMSEWVDTAECVCVEPQDDIFHVINDIIAKRSVRLVPVVYPGTRKIMGVITRTDLINVLIEEPGRFPESFDPENSAQKNLTQMVKSHLSHMGEKGQAAWRILEVTSAVASSMDMTAYVVGGFVRDVIIERSSFDIDIVVEGDGIAFAHALAKALGAHVREHRKMCTAVVEGPAIGLGPGMGIDVASARLEFYDSPGALPAVSLSSIKMDASRRDFTFNSLALQLNPTPRFCTLVDFYHGYADLKSGTIRVLHSLSFVEDCTRVLRAVRFEQRFGFHMHRQTEVLLHSAVKMGLLQKASGYRLFHELKAVFQDTHPLRCLERLDALGIMTQIHPALCVRSLLPLLAEIENVIQWYRFEFRVGQELDSTHHTHVPSDTAPVVWVLFLLPFLLQISHKRCVAERDAFLMRLCLGVDSKKVSQSVTSYSEWVHGMSACTADSRTQRSCTYRLLKGGHVEGVLLLMAKLKVDRDEAAVQRVKTYLTTDQFTQISINGKRLIELGGRPGPQFSEILNTILYARVDCHVRTPQEEEAMAADLLKQCK